MGIKPAARDRSVDSPADSVEAAAVARLRYVSDTMPGIARARSGRGFRYLTSEGKLLRDPETLERIRALAIPPAWTSVWICPTPTGHIQAVGRDARGRKQYRYHARWREVRDETKYARLIEFGRALPQIRRRVQRLLETTLIRVGNEEYARQNGSYGLTTLRTKHVRVTGPRLRFEFRGKSGKLHLVDVSDRRVARIVQQCQDLPGHELFQCVDEAGQRQSSADVNAYVREVAGREFTAKDFRTWAGTVLAAATLSTMGADGKSPSKRQVTQAVVAVAQRLGNTPTICRKCYIHPAVLKEFLESTPGQDMRLSRSAKPSSGTALRPEEYAVLSFLKKQAARPHRTTPRPIGRISRVLSARPGLPSR